MQKHVPGRQKASVYRQIFVSSTLKRPKSGARRQKIISLVTQVNQVMICYCEATVIFYCRIGNPEGNNCMTIVQENCSQICTSFRDEISTHNAEIHMQSFHCNNAYITCTCPSLWKHHLTLCGAM